MTNHDYEKQLVELLFEKRQVGRYEIYEDLLRKIIISDIPGENKIDVLEGLIEATSNDLYAKDSVFVKPEHGRPELSNNIIYLSAYATIQFLSENFSKIPNSIGVKGFALRVISHLLSRKFSILHDELVKHIAIPDNDWFATVEKHKGSKLEAADWLWWGIAEHQLLFDGMDNDILEEYFSALKSEIYKLGFCDNDSDIGLHDSPDMTVVKETINYIRTILDDIPKEKRKIAFNFIINSASCGRGMDTNTTHHKERMRQRISKCYSACLQFGFDTNKINKFAENQNYWNGDQDNENSN